MPYFHKGITKLTLELFLTALVSLAVAAIQRLALSCQAARATALRRGPKTHALVACLSLRRPAKFFLLTP
jgi:hypothetical protein